MFVLLGWLFERAWALYEWFGPKFAEYIDTVRNVWRDVVHVVEYVYQRAVDWVDHQVAWLRGQLANLFSSVIAILDSVISAVYDWARARLTEIREWVLSIKAEVLAWAGSVIGLLRTEVIAWIAHAKTVLRDVIRSYTDAVVAWASDTVRLYPALVDILAIFSPTNKARLVDFLGRGYDELMDFFDDPRAFVYEKLESTFLAFLSFILAKGIGGKTMSEKKHFNHKE